MAIIQENKMKVSLMNFTQDAKELLIFSKSTRLTMSPSLFEEIKNWPENKKDEEIEYIANTIPSSWEFVDYTFLIEGVTRAFTHQFVRNRHGSFAQQTMRVLNVSGFEYSTGPSIVKNEFAHTKYDEFMADCNSFYKELISLGCEIEDARGVLPTNINTNILVKFNLRTLSEIARKRASPRTQKEYRDVLDQIVVAVLEVHPWAKHFLKNKKIEAAKKLDDFINAMHEQLDGVVAIDKIDLLKAVDILRS